MRWWRAHSHTAAFVIFGLFILGGFVSVQVQAARQVDQGAKLEVQTKELRRQDRLLRHQDRVLRAQIRQACADRKAGWDASHALVVKAYTLTTPSPALLDAFPMLRPFYTPGNPQYDEQVRRQIQARDRVLTALGDRPVCRSR